MLGQNNLPTTSSEHVVPVFVLAAILAAILILSGDPVLATVSLLFDRQFLRGLVVMLTEVIIVSSAAGSIGIIAARVVLRSDWMTRTTIKFLRLGMWLPLFAAWALPTWWAPVWGGSSSVEIILRVAIPALPAVMFAACYYHLSACYANRLHRGAAILASMKAVLLHALLFIFLMQVPLYPDGWGWSLWYLDVHWMARPTATALLISGLLLLIFPATSSAFDKTAEAVAFSSVHEARNESRSSCLGAAMLWFLCFATWDRFFVFLRDVFEVAPPRYVIRAMYRLLTTGSMIANMEAPLWKDVAISIQEIGAGLLLTGVLAFIAVQVVAAAAPTIRLSWLFVFTYISPIVFAITLIPWVGVGLWLKAIIISRCEFFSVC